MQRQVTFSPGGGLDWQTRTPATIAVLPRIGFPPATGIEAGALEDLPLGQTACAIHCIAVLNLGLIRLLEDCGVYLLTQEEEIEDEEVKVAL